MQHRIRAAGIAVKDEHVLLVHHNLNQSRFWGPPGGGFEAQDISTQGTVAREFREETGLNVTVGPLIFVREFSFSGSDTHHLELFYLIDTFAGEINRKHLAGKPDEQVILEVEWIHRTRLPELKFYPNALCDLLWDKLTEDTITPTYLGLETS